MTPTLDFDRTPSWVTGIGELITGHFETCSQARRQFCGDYRRALSRDISKRGRLVAKSQSIDLKRLERKSAKNRPAAMFGPDGVHWLEAWDAKSHHLMGSLSAADWDQAASIADVVGVAPKIGAATHASFLAVTDKAHAVTYMVGGGEVQVRFARPPLRSGNATLGQLGAAHGVLSAAGLIDPEHAAHDINAGGRAFRIALAALGGVDVDPRRVKARGGVKGREGYTAVYDQAALTSYHVYEHRVEVDFKASGCQAKGAARLSTLAKAHRVLCRAGIIAPDWNDC